MNEVFPPLHTVSTAAAAAGSLVKIPCYGGPLLALVTDQSSEGGRSLVMLNATFPDRPPIVFAHNWRNEDACLAYKAILEFELVIMLTTLTREGTICGGPEE